MNIPFETRQTLEMASHSIDRPQPRTTLFPNFPLELRELIYQYVVPLPSSDIDPPRLCISAADVISGSHSFDPSWLPPIAHVSAESRTDVALYIIRQVEVYIPYHQTVRHLNRFLWTLPVMQGQGAIRRLNFPSFGAARLAKGCENVFIDFIKGCPQLVMLQIGVNAPDLRKTCQALPQPDGCYSDTMLNAESVVEVYKLAELKSLAGLIGISFELCPLFNGKQVRGCVAEVKRAALLMKKMFANCGKEVDVLVIDFRGNEWVDEA